MSLISLGFFLSATGSLLSCGFAARSAPRQMPLRHAINNLPKLRCAFVLPLPIISLRR